MWTKCCPSLWLHSEMTLTRLRAQLKIVWTGGERSTNWRKHTKEEWKVRSMNSAKTRGSWMVIEINVDILSCSFQKGPTLCMNSTTCFRLTYLAKWPVRRMIHFIRTHITAAEMYPCFISETAKQSMMDLAKILIQRCSIWLLHLT